MADPRRQSNLCAAERDAGLRKRLRVDEPAIALDSDLCADLEIAAGELDAIARLLGDDLKPFLSRT
jgi:hypothetical protein